MNNENLIPKAESDPHFPSLEEIRAQLERLSGGKKLETMRSLRDAKGIYLHEASFVDEHGDEAVYAYRRSGTYPEMQTATTTVDVVYYTGSAKDEVCAGGSGLSDYNETTGQWQDQ